MALCRPMLRQLSRRGLFGSPCWHRSSNPPRRGLVSITSNLGSPARRPRSEPRTFPTTGFDSVKDDQLVEEETMPEYVPEHFYPVRLGEVFNDRFQTQSKLGFGSSSTIWLARDLNAQDLHPQLGQLPFYEHLKTKVPSQHHGAGNIRKLNGSFEVVGPHGKHVVLVLQVSQMSLRDMNLLFFQDDGFNEDFVRAGIKELLEAVEFLHTEAQCVHTDIHPGNLLLGLKDDSIFKALADDKLSRPILRKQLPDRTLYFSRLMRPKVGPLLLSDFGETRIGLGPHAGDIMPIMYRAPETVLHAEWGPAVDIWSVGFTAWDLLEGKGMFTPVKSDGSFSDGVHLSQMIAALCPPPRELLDLNTERALDYWNEDGQWAGSVLIPHVRTLEAMETKLKDKPKFLQFIRRALLWDQKARPTAKELLEDLWLQED